MTVRDVIRRRLGAAAVLALASVGAARADSPPVAPLELPPVAPAGGAVPLPPTAPEAKPAEPKPPEAPVVPPPTAPAPAPVVPPPTAPVVPDVKPVTPPPAPVVPPAAPDVKPVVPPPADPPKPGAPKPSEPTPPLVLPGLGEKKPDAAKPVEPKPVETPKPAEPKAETPKPVETPKLAEPKIETPKVIEVAPMNPIVPVKPVEPAPVKPVTPMTPVTSVEPTPPPMVNPTPPVTPVAPSAPATPPAAGTVRPGTRSVDGLPAFHLMIAEAKVAHSKVRDYSGHMIRQDRVKGVLQPEQTAEVRAKTQPASLYLKWLAPAGAVGREAAYIAGKHAGRVRVKPAGNYGRTAWTTVEPTDPKALADGRTPLPYIGVGPIVARLERLARVEAQLRNPIFVSVGQYTYAGKPVTRYEAVLEQPHALRDAYRVVVFIDPDTKLPVRFEAYDQPTPGGDPMGELLEVCSFVNLKFNQGMPDSVFDR